MLIVIHSVFFHETRKESEDALRNLLVVLPLAIVCWFLGLAGFIIEGAKSYGVAAGLIVTLVVGVPLLVWLNHAAMQH